MGNIESGLRAIGYEHVATMPGGAKFGARKALILFLLILGIGLTLIGGFGFNVFRR
jgi:hypothetical protein